MASTKKILSTVFLVIFSLAITGGGIYFLTQQSSQLPGKGVVQEIISGDFLAKDISYKIINGQETKEYKIGYTASSTIFSALEGLSEKEKFTVTYKVYPEMGVLVQGINGLVNGSEGKYWQYWVNNVLGNVASDKYFLKPGDTVEWKFDIAPAF